MSKVLLGGIKDILICIRAVKSELSQLEHTGSCKQSRLYMTSFDVLQVWLYGIPDHMNLPSPQVTSKTVSGARGPGFDPRSLGKILM